MPPAGVPVPLRVPHEVARHVWQVPAFQLVASKVQQLQPAAPVDAGLLLGGGADAAQGADQLPGRGGQVAPDGVLALQVCAHAGGRPHRVAVLRVLAPRGSLQRHEPVSRRGQRAGVHAAGCQGALWQVTEVQQHICAGE